MQNRKFLGRVGGIEHPIAFSNEIVVISIPTLSTPDTKMRPSQCLGHAAGGNTVDLHDKDNKYQGSGEGGHQPFGIVINAVNCRVSTQYSVFMTRLKQRLLRP